MDEMVVGAISANPVMVGLGALKLITARVSDCNSPFVSAEELLKTVKPADLIEFCRGKYCHWAMYSGGGKIINIPAEGKDKKKVTITKQDLIEVAGKSGVRVNNQEKRAAELGLKKRSPKEALAAAKADLDETLPYNYTEKNCEHYCTKWLYGKEFSCQVDKVRDAAGPMTRLVYDGYQAVQTVQNEIHQGLLNLIHDNH